MLPARRFRFCRRFDRRLRHDRFCLHIFYFCCFLLLHTFTDHGKLLKKYGSDLILKHFTFRFLRTVQHHFIQRVETVCFVSADQRQILKEDEFLSRRAYHITVFDSCRNRCSHRKTVEHRSVLRIHILNPPLFSFLIKYKTAVQRSDFRIADA